MPRPDGDNNQPEETQEFIVRANSEEVEQVLPFDDDEDDDEPCPMCAHCGNWEVGEEGDLCGGCEDNTSVCDFCHDREDNDDIRYFTIRGRISDQSYPSEGEGTACRHCFINGDNVVVCSGCSEAYAADDRGFTWAHTYDVEVRCYNCLESDMENCDDNERDNMPVEHLVVIWRCNPDHSGFSDIELYQIRNFVSNNGSSTSARRNFPPDGHYASPRVWDNEFKKHLALDLPPFHRVRRYFGMEIESINGGEFIPSIQSILPGSNFVYDGSITNRNDTGKEILTPIMRGEGALRKLKAVFALGLEFDSSCGIHIHMDGRDLNWQDLRKLYFFSLKHEDSFYAMVNESRKSCAFCSPLLREPKRLQMLLKAEEKQEAVALMMAVHPDGLIRLKEMQKEKGRPIIVCKSKYEPTIPNFSNREHMEVTNHNARGVFSVGEPRRLWMNLVSWVYRGSVEYRLFQGTSDFPVVSSWVLGLQWMFAYVERTPLQMILKEERPLKELMPRRVVEPFTDLLPDRETPLLIGEN